MLRNALISVFILLFSIESSPDLIDYPSQSSNNDNEYSDSWMKNEPSSISNQDLLVDTGTNSSFLSEPNNGSYMPSISSDGRYVAFKSQASNLIESDTNGVFDIFVWDQVISKITRVSISSDNVEGNGGSYDPSISEDGRLVTFYSYASNMVDNDLNGKPDVYVHDTVSGTTTRVSVSFNGNEGNDGSYHPSISASGRFIAFESQASNLVANDSNDYCGLSNYWERSCHDIFVYDLQTGEIKLVSINSSGQQFTRPSLNPVLSSDGRYVAFEVYGGIFVHNTQTGQTSVVSVHSDGTRGNRESSHPTLSGDNRYIAFSSRSDNLIDDDNNNAWDVFVHDIQTNQTRRVSLASDGTEGNGPSTEPSISNNGQYVTFVSMANNLKEGDANGYSDIYIRDLISNVTKRVSLSSQGGEGIMGSFAPSISSDGGVIVFYSSSGNLINNDNNGVPDIFINDILTGNTTRVPISSVSVSRINIPKGKTDKLIQHISEYPSTSVSLSPQTNSPNQLISIEQLSSISSGQTVALVGKIVVFWGDGEPVPNYSSEKIFLIDDTGQMIELLLSEHQIQSYGGAYSLDRQNVILDVELIKSTSEDNNSTIINVKSIQFVSEENEINSSRWYRLGNHRYISILCKFSDITDEPKPLTYYKEMYSSNYPGLDHYWRELSYNKMNVQGSDAVGWYVLPNPRLYYVYDRDGDGYEDPDYFRLEQDCISIADPDIYFPDYYGIQLMFNYGIGGAGGYAGGYSGEMDGQKKFYEVTGYSPTNSLYQTVAHEMGHGLGLPHSSGPYGLVYDSPYDVMSWGASCNYFFNEYECFGNHTISYHKYILGWLEQDQVITASRIKSSIQVIERLALPQTNDPLMIIIPINGSQELFYTVETRCTGGYDESSCGYENIIVMHKVNSDPQRDIDAYALVVNVSEGNAEDTSDEGGRWIVGEVFEDLDNHISVSIEAKISTGFIVNINGHLNQFSNYTYLPITVNK